MNRVQGLASRFWGVLQRGRARAGAEWIGNVPFVTNECALQRGRARAGAECTSPAVGGVVNGVASTGPRPRGRGMMPGVVATDEC